MKETAINQPLYTEELEKLQLGLAEQEVRQIIEEDLVPSPSVLHKYNQLVPDGADRILKLIEEEKKHKRKMEKSKLDGRNVVKILIILFGFALGLITVIAVMDTRDSSLGFALMWVGMVVIIAAIFVFFNKDKLKDGNDSPQVL